MQQLRRHEVKFKEYMRMNTATFDCLLKLIREDIEKSIKNFLRAEDSVDSSILNDRRSIVLTPLFTATVS